VNELEPAATDMKYNTANTAQFYGEPAPRVVRHISTDQGRKLIIRVSGGAFPWSRNLFCK